MSRGLRKGRIMKDIYCQLFVGTYEWMVKVEKVNASAHKKYLSFSALLAMALAHFSLVYSTLIMFDIKGIDLKATCAIGIVILLMLWFGFIKGGTYERLLEQNNAYKKKAFRFSLIVNSLMLSSFFIVAFYKIMTMP